LGELFLLGGHARLKLVVFVDESAMASSCYQLKGKGTKTLPIQRCLLPKKTIVENCDKDSSRVYTTSWLDLQKAA
jgi:hypothetical protein